MNKKRILIPVAAVILAVLGYFLWSRFGAGQPEDVLSEYAA